jgi:flagellar motility protein MotE (MotC chaperone)
MIRNKNPYAQAMEQERASTKTARRVSPLKVLLAAVVINLAFLGAYFFLNDLTASAADEGKAQPQAAARGKDPAPAQDMRAQLDSVKQREELLRVRQRELQLLESRIDEKIRRLSELETNVKAEIAMYKGISDERTKHLVKIYSSMKPNAAATLMNQMDIEVATEVFLSMKGEIAGGILANMEPAKAAAISKRLMSNRKMSTAAPQAVPQSAPQGQAGQAPTSAMTEPGAAPAAGPAPGPGVEPGAMAQAAPEAVKPAPKARPKAKAVAKAKRWTPPAAKARSMAVIPQAAPSAATQAAQPQAAQPQAAIPQPAAKQEAPQTAPLSSPQQAPQASATQAAPKTAAQALAQSSPAQAEQK